MSTNILEAQMTLNFIEITDWPKLSWVAIIKPGIHPILLLHGKCVETNSSWCVEAVWDADFSNGDFDQTDLVIGTGVRVRGAQVFFVSSGDTLNRLHWFQEGEKKIVSNSLPALLAVAKIDLLDNYPYAEAMESIVNGLHSYQREIPSTGGPIKIVYYRNLLLEKDKITEVPKPSSAPDFIDYSAYREYLFKSAKKLGENASACGRRNAVKSLATVSSGYDSCAAAVIAREAGVSEAVTISQGRRDASNLFDLNDSGELVAEQLGMQCGNYLRDRDNYPFEDTAWASMGNVGDINLAIFDYPQPLCFLFTGIMGDTLWNKNTIQSEPLQRITPSGARFNETRLALGVFICSPVFWGCQKASQILDLSHLPEMRPWLLGNSYDRPIPRRLLEESGVQRGSFGKKKRVSSFNRRYGRPLSIDLRPDFSLFLAERGIRPGSSFSEKLALILAGIDWMFLRKLPETVRFSCKDWIPLPSPTLFFLWGNQRLKNRYRQGVVKSSVQSDETVMHLANESKIADHSKKKNVSSACNNLNDRLSN